MTNVETLSSVKIEVPDHVIILKEQDNPVQNIDLENEVAMELAES